MIAEVSIDYLNDRNQKTVTTLGNSFIQECVEKPPKSKTISKVSYDRIPVRKRIIMHCREYVKDVGGRSPRFRF